VGIERLDTPFIHNRDLARRTQIEAVGILLRTCRVAKHQCADGNGHAGRNPVTAGARDAGHSRRGGHDIQFATRVGALGPSGQESSQSHAELEQHPHRHQHAGDVGNHPPGVGHDLQSGRFLTCDRVLHVIGLIEGLSPVTQGIVHPDVAGNRRPLFGQNHIGGIVLGRVGPDVLVEPHIIELYLVRLVIPLETQGDTIRLAVDFQRLGLGQLVEEGGRIGPDFRVGPSRPLA
jgi:hypothetical protein